jgi:hypothetical protein
VTAPDAAGSPSVVLAQYVVAQQAVRASLLVTLQRLWAQLSSWHRPDAERFARMVVPLVQGAQQATSSLTTSYLARSVSQMTGQPLRVPAVSPMDFVGAAVRKADPMVVYQRPFVQVWTDLANGKPLEQAVESAGHRLVSLAATDVQLAKTATSQAVLSEEPNVVGYRRVLTGDKSCGLCIVASTQRYHKIRKMEIHPGCDCGIAPIYGDDDPGRILDLGALGDVHEAIEDRFGKSSPSAREIAGAFKVVKGKRVPLLYKDVLVSHEHGEIGPVLAVRGQEFTGPSEIPGDS